MCVSLFLWVSKRGEFVLSVVQRSGVVAQVQCQKVTRVTHMGQHAYGSGASGGGEVESTCGGCARTHVRPTPARTHLSWSWPLGASQAASGVCCRSERSGKSKQDEVRHGGIRFPQDADWRFLLRVGGFSIPLSTGRARCRHLGERWSSLARSTQVFWIAAEVTAGGEHTHDGGCPALQARREGGGLMV